MRLDRLLGFTLKEHYCRRYERLDAVEIFSFTHSPLLQPLLNRETPANEYENRALSLQQLGRYADAASDFDAAVAEGPVSWQRLWHRAICLAELGEAFRPSAARDLRACVSMAKNDQPPPEVMRIQICGIYTGIQKATKQSGCSRSAIDT